MGPVEARPPSKECQCHEGRSTLSVHFALRWPPWTWSPRGGWKASPIAPWPQSQVFRWARRPITLARWTIFSRRPTAAILEAKRATDADLAEWAAELGPNTDLADAVTDYVMHALTHRWGRLVVEHELYMAALRRPQLRPLSREWDEAFPAVLSKHTDTVIAETVAMVSTHSRHACPRAG